MMYVTKRDNERESFWEEEEGKMITCFWKVG